MRHTDRKLNLLIEQVAITAKYRDDRFLEYLMNVAKEYLEDMDLPWHTERDAILEKELT